jgi:hypothetical protein
MEKMGGCLDIMEIVVPKVEVLLGMLVTGQCPSSCYRGMI